MNYQLFWKFLHFFFDHRLLNSETVPLCIWDLHSLPLSRRDRKPDWNYCYRKNFFFYSIRTLRCIWIMKFWVFYQGPMELLEYSISKTKFKFQIQITKGWLNNTTWGIYNLNLNVLQFNQHCLCFDDCWQGATFFFRFCSIGES